MEKQKLVWISDKPQ